MSPRVVGFDLSITATGIAWCDGSTYTVTSKTRGDARLTAIRGEVDRAVDGRHVDLVVIEDLPTHARAAGITGMVHGVVRARLLDLGVSYVLVTPASLKKYATGKGNADKTAMAVAAFKRAGIEPADDNQVDAWWLRAMGLDYLGAPPVTMPASHHAAMEKVAWPPLPPLSCPDCGKPGGDHSGVCLLPKPAAPPVVQFDEHMSGGRVTTVALPDGEAA